MQNLSAKNHRKIQTPGLWHRFCPPVGKQNDMPLTDTSRNEIANSLSILKVIAGVVLLAAVSWEIIGGDHTRFSQSYLTVQLVVCILFLCDFFVRWAAAERKGRFFGRNILFFLISIPYLNILAWSGADLPRYWAMLIGVMPLMRAFLALYVVVQWLVDNKIRRLFTAYIFTVVVFTYISALVFYDYEIFVNDKLHGFGNALWWAWMNVTTVGAEIFAVTAIGKVITILLPTLGMMMFPIFTTYILQEYTHKRSPTNKTAGPGSGFPSLATIPWARPARANTSGLPAKCRQPAVRIG